MTEQELKILKELEFQRAQLFVEFAKYGFYGTLTFAMVGAVLVLALACLSAFTSFKIDAWLVAMSGIIAVGSIAFGYLSLWQAPNIIAKWQGLGEFGFGITKPTGQASLNVK
jgi:hypothetical protein